MNKLLRIFLSSIYALRYLKNPLVIFRIPFKSEITIAPKFGDKIAIRNRQFLDYMDLFSMGWIYKDGIYQNGKYKFKVLEPYVLLEDFIQMYRVDDICDKNVLDVGGLYGETGIIILKELKSILLPLLHFLI